MPDVNQQPTTKVVDVTDANFPVVIRFGDKEYLLVKSRFDKLMLNRKD